MFMPGAGEAKAPFFEPSAEQIAKLEAGLPRVIATAWDKDRDQIERAWSSYLFIYRGGIGADGRRKIWLSARSMPPNYLPPRRPEQAIMVRALENHLGCAVWWVTYDIGRNALTDLDCSL